MKIRLPLFASLTALCAAPGLAAELIQPLPPDTADLSAYKWQSRPVVIFADAPQDGPLLMQLGLLDSAMAGLEERDILVFIDSQPDVRGLLRESLGIDGFHVLLIGKDGGVKLDVTEPISADALFETIDAMPMRQRETK